MGQISYRLLSEDIIINEFTCGNPSIDQMLKDGFYSTLLKQGFCYEIVIRDRIVGYFFYTYILVSCNDENMDSYCSTLMGFNYPALHIKFIAIDKKFQRKKIGTNVLRLFISNARKLHKDFPVRFVVIDALKDLESFYSKLGFQPVDDQDISANLSTIRMFFDLFDDDERQRLQDYISIII